MDATASPPSPWLRLRLALWRAPFWPLQYRLLLLLLMALLSVALGQHHILKPLQQEGEGLARLDQPAPPGDATDASTSGIEHPGRPEVVAIEDWLHSALEEQGLTPRALNVANGKDPSGDEDTETVRLRAAGPRVEIAAFIERMASWPRRPGLVSLAVEHGEPGATRLELELRVEPLGALAAGEGEAQGVGSWRAALGGRRGAPDEVAAGGPGGVLADAAGPWRLVGHLGHGEPRGVVAAPDGRLLAVAAGEALGESGWLVERIGADHLALRRAGMDGRTVWWRLGLETEVAAP